MSRHVLWQVVGDPERGYIAVEDMMCRPVRLNEGEPWFTWLDDDDEPTEVEPARCQLCEREIDEDASLPLCRNCESTARAHARLEQSRREWEAEGRPT